MVTPVARAAPLQDNGDHLHFDSIARLKGLLQAVSRVRFTPSMLQKAVELFSRKTQKALVVAHAVHAVRPCLKLWTAWWMMLFVIRLKISSMSGRPAKQRGEITEEGPPACGATLAACDAAWLDIGSGHRVGGADVSRVDMTSGDHEFGARLQMRGEQAVRTFNGMRQLAGHRLSAPGRWRRCISHVDMTKGDHEFGARFVESLELASLRSCRCEVRGQYTNLQRHAPGTGRARPVLWRPQGQSL